MFANRYTALIDVEVLVSAPKRNLIFTLARAEMFRFRWTNRILSEAETLMASALQSQGYCIHAARAAKVCKAMRAAFPESMICGNFDSVPTYPKLAANGDHHILHAAIRSKSSMIVTENISGYPDKALENYELEAKSADGFIADAIGLDEIRTAEAVKNLRERLKQPGGTAQTLLDDWEQNHGLTETVALLRPYQGLI